MLRPFIVFRVAIPNSASIGGTISGFAGRSASVVIRHGRGWEPLRNLPLERLGHGSRIQNGVDYASAQIQVEPVKTEPVGARRRPVCVRENVGALRRRYRAEH